MRRFFIEVPERTFEDLMELALRERRPVRDQAGVLLERTIEQEAARVRLDGDVLATGAAA